jgi:CRISPR-associated protein Cmr6
MPAKKPRGRPFGQMTSGGGPVERRELRYPIPKASAEAWKQLKQQPDASLNPSLIFDRFVQDWGWMEQQHRDREAKKNAWQELVEIAPRTDEGLLAAWEARWERTAQALHADPFTLRTDWRFIAGLGRKGPLEVGFTFHRYGFPILPGSSVKGIARAYALLQVGGKLDPTDLNKLDQILGEEDEKKYAARFAKEYSEANEDTRALAGQFRCIFGTTGAAGQAVFPDAIPAQKPTLELDVMNPHYPKYYQGTEWPTDWQNPVPVYFLTVAANTPFRFAVGWRRPPDGHAKRLRDLTKQWLVTGLTELGAGAKTSAGYGYFAEVK